MENRKRLVRSSSDRWIAGILGGIAAYMGWDTALLRIAYLLLTLCSCLLYTSDAADEL